MPQIDDRHIRVGLFPWLQVAAPEHVAGAVSSFVLYWQGREAATVEVSPSAAGNPPTWTVVLDPESSPYRLEVDLLSMDRDAAHLVDAHGGDTPIKDFRGEAGFIVWPAQEWRFAVVDDTHRGMADRSFEQCSHDPRVLRRHYTRPRHMTSYGDAEAPSVFQESFHRARLRQIGRFLHRYAPSARTVVDVGAGTSLVRMATGGRHAFLLVCTDGDRPALEFARAGDDRIVVIESTPEVLPLRDGSADFIYAGEVIEHVPDPVATLLDWARALAPGGHLAITTPQAAHLLNRVRDAAVKENKEHLYEWRWHDLLKLLWNTGFEVVHQEGLYYPMLARDDDRGWHDRLGYLRYSRWTAPVGWLFAEAGRIPKLGKRWAYNQAAVVRYRG